MQQQPPQRRSNPPHIGPVEQKSSGPNWLLVSIIAVIIIGLVVGVGFLAFAFFLSPTVLEQAETVSDDGLTVANFSTPTPANEQAASPASNTEAQPRPENSTSDQGANADTTPQTENPPSEQSPAVNPVGEQPEPPSSPAVMASPDFGVQAFLYWRPEVAERDLQLINDIKFDWVKQEFPWREIEGAAKGDFTWENTDRMMKQIDDHGLKVIARISTQPAWAGGGYPEIGPPDNYQDFVDFLTILTTRYKGRIDAYQIWNEPNLNREWGNRPPNPAEYVELLRLSYETIKAIDPNAWVITAGLAPTSRWDNVAMPDTVFVQGMYDVGAQPYFDALGAHGAGYKVPPETDPAVVANDPVLNNGDPSPPDLKRIYAFRHVEDLRQVMVDNNDIDKRVVVLEFGWTVDDRPGSPYAWHAVTEREQAIYIVGAYNYAAKNWQPWIGVMSLIYLASADWSDDDEQTYWSITYPEYPEFRARPAYWGLVELGRQREP